MNPESTNSPLLACWPFWALDLTPSATGADIEKAGREIMSKLRLGVRSAEQYVTPLGKQTRDEHVVVEAQHRLQDPNTRLIAEYWYVEPTINASSDTDVDEQTREWEKKLGISLWAD